MIKNAHISQVTKQFLSHYPGLFISVASITEVITRNKGFKIQPVDFRTMDWPVSEYDTRFSAQGGMYLRHVYPLERPHPAFNRSIRVDAELYWRNPNFQSPYINIDRSLSTLKNIESVLSFPGHGPILLGRFARLLSSKNRENIVRELRVLRDHGLIELHGPREYITRPGDKVQLIETYPRKENKNAI